MIDSSTEYLGEGTVTGADITLKLQAWGRGDRSQLDELLPFIIANMRAVARRMPKRGVTLNTTVLVHEVWLRFAGVKLELADREHFTALVGRAMRQILVDHARAQQRLKRGGGAARVTLSETSALTESQIEELMAVDELLERLENENPRRCRVFEMRYFSGFSVDEVAEALQVSENTVIRDYRLACAWLRFHIGESLVSNGSGK